MSLPPDGTPFKSYWQPLVVAYFVTVPLCLWGDQKGSWGANPDDQMLSSPRAPEGCWAAQPSDSGKQIFLKFYSTPIGKENTD